MMKRVGINTNNIDDTSTTYDPMDYADYKPIKIDSNVSFNKTYIITIDIREEEEKKRIREINRLLQELV